MRTEISIAAALTRDGFAIVEEFLDDSTLAQLRDAYDRTVIAYEAALQPGSESPTQVMMPSLEEPLFADNAAIDLGRRLLEPLWGESVVTFDKLVYKPPGDARPTPWHVDAAYADTPVLAPGSHVPLTSVQFWVTLDEVDEWNGCMHFVPGFHERGVLEHEVLSGDPASSGRLLAIVEPERRLPLNEMVVARLPAGGATVHTYNTPHYTSPNSTDRPRRAYLFNLGDARRFKGFRVTDF